VLRIVLGLAGRALEALLGPAEVRGDQAVRELVRGCGQEGGSVLVARGDPVRLRGCAGPRGHGLRGCEVCDISDLPLLRCGAIAGLGLQFGMLGGRVVGAVEAEVVVAQL